MSRYLLFISHSSGDGWIAGQISKELEAHGFRTWLDSKDLKGGDIIGALRWQRKTVTPLLNGVGPRELGSIRDVQAIDLNEFDRFLEQLKGRAGGRR